MAFIMDFRTICRPEEKQFENKDTMSSERRPSNQDPVVPCGGNFFPTHTYVTLFLPAVASTDFATVFFFFNPQQQTDPDTKRLVYSDAFTVLDKVGFQRQQCDELNHKHLSLFDVQKSCEVYLQTY